MAASWLAGALRPGQAGLLGLVLVPSRGLRGLLAVCLVTRSLGWLAAGCCGATRGDFDAVDVVKSAHLSLRWCPYALHGKIFVRSAHAGREAALRDSQMFNYPVVTPGPSADSTCFQRVKLTDPTEPYFCRPLWVT